MRSVDRAAIKHLSSLVGRVVVVPWLPVGEAMTDFGAVVSTLVGKRGYWQFEWQCIVDHLRGRQQDAMDATVGIHH